MHTHFSQWWKCISDRPVEMGGEGKDFLGPTTLGGHNIAEKYWKEKRPDVFFLTSNMHKIHFRLGLVQDTIDGAYDTSQGGEGNTSPVSPHPLLLDAFSVWIWALTEWSRAAREWFPRIPLRIRGTFTRSGSKCWYHWLDGMLWLATSCNFRHNIQILYTNKQVCKTCASLAGLIASFIAVVVGVLVTDRHQHWSADRVQLELLVELSTVETRSNLHGLSLQCASTCGRLINK